MDYWQEMSYWQYQPYSPHERLWIERDENEIEPIEGIKIDEVENGE